jgi:hypothetical protein
VISEYVGVGEVAEYLSRQDESERLENKESRLKDFGEMGKWIDIDYEVNQALEFCTDLLNARLLVSGFHTHKGQWRYRHGKR